MSKGYQRFPSISKKSSKMFPSYRKKFRFVQQLNVVNLIALMMSLISLCVKISNLSLHVKMTCFQRNPCNSLVYIIKCLLCVCFSNSGRSRICNGQKIQTVRETAEFLLVLHALVCHLTVVQSHDCSITAVQLFFNGKAVLDTFLIV